MQLCKSGIFAVALTSTLLAASAAHASSVTLALPSSITQAVKPGVDGGLNVNFQGTTTNNAYVGTINWTVSSSTTSGYVAGQQLTSYCIQGLQNVVTGGTYTYSVVSLDSTGLPNGGADAGVLDSTAAKQIQGLADSYFATAGTVSGSYTANETAAAFQLSVWEIEYDGGVGGETFPQAANYNFFAQGNFKATANNSEGTAALSLANSWLKNFTAATSVSSFALVSSSAQDQLLFQPGGGGTTPGVTQAVPLPAALPAGLSLLGTLFGVRKLRRKFA